MQQAYIYEPRSEDRLFCQTVLNLFYREHKQNPENAYSILLGLQETKSTRANTKLHFRLDIANENLAQIINDYNLDQTRLKQIRLNAHFRKTLTSIKLIIFQDLHLFPQLNFLSPSHFGLCKENAKFLHHYYFCNVQPLLH